MAVVHRAELRPDKIEILTAWLPVAPFAAVGVPEAVERIGSYRFDDPAGEVGMEVILVEGPDGAIQVPFTYRGAPLEGGRLVAELEHSVLGHRWVYDATTDPVFVAQLVATIVAGAPGADFVTPDGSLLPNPVEMRGTGAAAPQAPVQAISEVSIAADGVTTVIATDVTSVVFHHRPVATTEGPALHGTWPAGEGVLAALDG